VLARETERAADAIGGRVELEKRRILQLASGTPIIHDKHSCNGARYISTKVLLDQCEGQVYSRGHTRRCPDTVLMDVDLIGINMHGRIHGLQLCGEAPMRRRAPSVEKPTRSQQKRAHTNTAGAAGTGGCGANEIDCRRRESAIRHPGITDDKKGVDRIRNRSLAHHLDARRTLYLTAHGRHDAHPVATRYHHSGEPECLQRAAQIDQGQLRIDEKNDVPGDGRNHGINVL